MQVDVDQSVHLSFKMVEISLPLMLCKLEMIHLK